jgi:hypothetical protein
MWFDENWKDVAGRLRAYGCRAAAIDVHALMARYDRG